MSGEKAEVIGEVCGSKNTSKFTILGHDILAPWHRIPSTIILDLNLGELGT